ncbi:hypothetical protein [Duganella sp. FT27W]|uniref:hypothetical protein n=1 Tax=Duganella sp. FT27W TaxID=2654636 RepID=UPI00128BD82B|nr:hypothetical protein [Duganella sp. FT27W]MPQ56374.1 hypothetical protein [Duganella sp. FT27W]
MATKVTMYEAKDGSLHKTPSACDAKNVELRLAPAIEKFVDGLAPNAPGMTNTTESTTIQPFCIELGNLPQFLLGQSEALRKVLNDALVVKKPRKGAAKPASAPTPAPTDPSPVPAAAPQQAAAQVAASSQVNVNSIDDLDDALAQLEAQS